MVSTPAVRIAWGTVLVLFPDTVLHRCSRTPPTLASRTTARALGARHVLQGCAVARGTFPAVWGAVPDALHAATMAGLALCNGRWRTAALADVVVATAFAVVTWRTARPQAPRPR
ncbi:hypothetical protein [Streptomyces sp. SLBN-31]|uniref:hypothetical protein n=1 Tax=Streptomyces sp. SLBN-31 TaxID=2768444 RepID=UPI00115273AE|nr:hypothetical protein [Streptomyces sp. SLBN-31]TQJ91273.1 hypothetical protein FBY22_2083 [Streptomyces sp. SLBN-31]